MCMAKIRPLAYRGAQATSIISSSSKRETKRNQKNEKIQEDQKVSPGGTCRRANHSSPSTYTPLTKTPEDSLSPIATTKAEIILKQAETKYVVKVTSTYFWWLHLWRNTSATVLQHRRVKRVDSLRLLHSSMVHPNNNVPSRITTPRDSNRRPLSINRHCKDNNKRYLLTFSPKSQMLQKCKPREQVAAKPIPLTSTSETLAREQAALTAAQTACHISVEDCCSKTSTNQSLTSARKQSKSYLNTVSIFPNLYRTTRRA